MADMIVEASGGGVALWYDKLTGDWYDPRTGKRNADALIAGEAVVLVADWVKESDITDSGFSEAAAESIRSEQHTSELQSLMRISYAVFCLKKKKYTNGSQPRQANHT